MRRPTCTSFVGIIVSCFLERVYTHEGETRSLILGGETAHPNRFSFAEVTLQQSDHQCGGSVIAPDIILTAAHCQDWIRTAQVHRHDFENVSDEFQTFRPSAILTHPQFNSDNFAYDFAVVTLNEQIEDAQIIRLNQDSSFPVEGDDLRVLGYGVVDNRNKQSPVYATDLQIGYVTFLNNDDCENSVVRGKSLYEGEIYPEMMCSASGTVDACRGDSGGPLIYQGQSAAQDVQVGIVSWGRGCLQYPGVYSRVSHGYEWIREQVCWHSRDPPDYMACLESEQNPALFPQAVAHTSTSSLSADTVRVVVDIQLDAKSGETAWFLADSTGKNVLNRPPGTYTDKPNQQITESVHVSKGSSLLFGIRDLEGDGICCDEGIGWYRIGLDTGDGRMVRVVYGDGSFGESGGSWFTATSDSVSRSHNGDFLPFSPPDVSASANVGDAHDSGASTTTLVVGVPMLLAAIAMMLDLV